jgi:serine phosphatase RsbU (regulator of sigma subunit)
LIRRRIFLTCGNRPCWRLGGDLRPLTDGKVALPLGLEDDFTAFTATWSPGDRLLLYTDGLVESCRGAAPGRQANAAGVASTLGALPACAEGGDSW